ncbi:MAG: hybrid sensor histidine kinase/response regulator [Pseudomonadota bacterium]
MSTAANPGRKHAHAYVVLFVDDEPHSCKWFARLFSDEFNIVTAGSVGEAEVRLRQESARIAVLVTDMRMPDRDGLALLKIAQAEHRHVVRLMASAYAEKEMAVAAINLGRVQGILEKPFDEPEVRRSLRDALQTYQQHEYERNLLESRASAVRETLSFLAHELNTPLATITGYLSLLKERHVVPGPDSPAGMALITERKPGTTLNMVSAAERATLYAQSLVSAFVQTARVSYRHPTPSHLQASATLTTLLLHYPFQGSERAWITTDLSSDFVLPDHRDLIYLVLCTLIRNAMFALHDNPPTRSPVLHIALLNPSTTLNRDGFEICMSDNGPGIDPGVLARLTREPVTTRGDQGGTGMGLIFCRRVMESMRGSIHVQSKLSRGTSVTLRFPPNN